MKDLVFYPLMAGIALATGVEVWDNMRPSRISMQTVRLEYIDGAFHQSHVVQGTDQLRAEWSATINRRGQILCSGGGSAPYRTGDKPPMSPDVWTGGDCPDDLSGAEASATWEYVDEANFRHRISKTIQIP